MPTTSFRSSTFKTQSSSRNPTTSAMIQASSPSVPLLCLDFNCRRWSCNLTGPAVYESKEWLTGTIKILLFWCRFARGHNPCQSRATPTRYWKCFSCITLSGLTFMFMLLLTFISFSSNGREKRLYGRWRWVRLSLAALITLSRLVLLSTNFCWLLYLLRHQGLLPRGYDIVRTH